jgi:hypothetical protein
MGDKIPPPCADCLEIWKPRPPGTLTAQASTAIALQSTYIITVFGVSESYTDYHFLCEVRAWPKDELSIDCVLCEVAAEAEETGEHLAYNTVQHIQTATVRGVK